MLLSFYSIVSSTVYMYSNGHGIHMDLSMESKVDMPPFHMESSGIHDVHGTTNWLRPQPTLIPWIPNGLTQGR